MVLYLGICCCYPGDVRKTGLRRQYHRRRSVPFLSSLSSALPMLADYISGENEHLMVWLLEHHEHEAVVFPNATLGAMLPNNTKTLSTNLEMLSPIESVSTS